MNWEARTLSQDPFNKEYHLRTKLDEYHVDIPDFPMKPKKWERFLQVLASPADDPLEQVISTSKGAIALKVVTVAGTIAFSLIQILIFL